MAAHQAPWDSPGKNTGVACHCLLQCMKVKSESEVAQSSLTLRDPMDCRLLRPPDFPGKSTGVVPLPSPQFLLVNNKSWGPFHIIHRDHPHSCLNFQIKFIRVSVSSVAQSCPTLCDPMNHSMPGLPVHHQLLEFTQTHVHRVSDAIQPSHPLSSPSPPAPNPSQHQGLFQ